MKPRQWRRGLGIYTDGRSVVRDDIHVRIIAIEDLDQLGAVVVVGELEGAGDAAFVGGIPAIFVAAVAIIAIDDLGPGRIGRSVTVTDQDDAPLDGEADADGVGGSPDIALGIAVPGALIGFGSVVDRLGLCREREGAEESGDGNKLFHGVLFFCV